MKKITLVITFTLALFSCEKEKQIIIENTDIPLLSKVLTGGVTHMEYSYNEANLVTEEKSKFTYTRHSYSDKNLLTTSEFYIDPALFSSSSTFIEAAMNRKEWVNPDNTPKSLTRSFEYDDKDQLIKITYNRPSVNNSEYSEYSFENDRISRQNIYWKNVLSYYIDYLYDVKGNLIKESKYYVPSTGIAELWTSTEYEYDHMQNPFQSFKRLLDPGKFTNRNNIIKETYTIYFEVDQWTQKVQIINNTYEYNANGYPIKVNGEAEYMYK
jgi:hypothetical protein